MAHLRSGTHWWIGESSGRNGCGIRLESGKERVSVLSIEGGGSEGSEREAYQDDGPHNVRSEQRPGRVQDRIAYCAIGHALLREEKVG